MLIIGNGRMITRDASKAFIENGAVAMDGNTIVMVGTTDEVKKAYPDGEFVDARGGVIMPAFINTHEHIYSSFARGLSIKGYNPKGFLDILDGISISFVFESELRIKNRIRSRTQITNSRTIIRLNIVLKG